MRYPYPLDAKCSSAGPPDIISATLPVFSLTLRWRGPIPRTILLSDIRVMSIGYRRCLTGRPVMPAGVIGRRDRSILLRIPAGRPAPPSGISAACPASASSAGPWGTSNRSVPSIPSARTWPWPGPRLPGALSSAHYPAFSEPCSTVLSLPINPNSTPQYALLMKFSDYNRALPDIYR